MPIVCSLEWLFGWSLWLVCALSLSIRVLLCYIVCVVSCVVCGVLLCSVLQCRCFPESPPRRGLEADETGHFSSGITGSLYCWNCVFIWNVDHDKFVVHLFVPPGCLVF